MAQLISETHYFGLTSVARIYDRNLLWNCEEHQSIRLLLHWVPAFPMKFSTTGNLYWLKSWLWLAAVACVVHWPISNALLNDIWLTRFTRMYNWNYWHKHRVLGRLAQMVKASTKTTNYKPLSRWYEFDSRQGQFVCLGMFVNGLAVICRSGWFHSVSCLSRGRTHVLAFLHLNSRRHCCILGKKGFG